MTIGGIGSYIQTYNRTSLLVWQECVKYVCFKDQHLCPSASFAGPSRSGAQHLSKTSRTDLGKLPRSVMVIPRSHGPVRKVSQ